MVIENKGYLLIFTVKKYTKHIRQNDSYWGIWIGTVQITKESRKKTFSRRVWGGALRTDSTGAVSSSTVASTVTNLNASP